jgi:hypothetical protein
MPKNRAAAAVLVAAVLAAGVAACGGSSSKSSQTQTQTNTTTVTTATSRPQGGSAAVTSGPVRGAVTAADHAPKVNKLWSYSVHVTDAAGRPLSGTVEIQFVYQGQVVGRDTPPSHPVTSGRWHDRITFPSASIGMPLTFRAVVHTSLGTITLDWPIQVAA